jgi:DNA-directed RNA polymerase subunit M/transcription elongation factor TFIIS
MEQARDIASRACLKEETEVQANMQILVKATHEDASAYFSLRESGLEQSTQVSKFGSTSLQYSRLHFRSDDEMMTTNFVCCNLRAVFCLIALAPSPGTSSDNSSRSLMEI